MRYIFRDIVILEYDPERKQMVAPMLEDSSGEVAFNFCIYTPDDYKRLSKFFDTAWQHAEGKLHESFLKDVRVS